MPYNVSHLTFELELLHICVRAQSTPHLGASTGDQIGDATLQGWEVGTQNRVKDAKKESRPIPIALVLLLAEQGRRCYFIYPPPPSSALLMRPNMESNSFCSVYFLLF